uniref:Uncharacterized protein n=1 Tax=Rhizophora mucronata TaxID=61149 RepID=A0A2P2JVL0_RHIMU
MVTFVAFLRQNFQSQSSKCSSLYPISKAHSKNLSCQ